jgi:phage FluMu protein Com
MQPLHGERGRLYFAIKCSSPRCEEVLLLAEVNSVEKSDLDGKTVRCSVCTKETSIEDRRIFVREIR